MSLTIEHEKQNRMSFLDIQIKYEKIKHLPILSNMNLPLVKFIHILTNFYNLHVILVMFTHSLTDVSKYAQFGLNYKLVGEIPSPCG